MPSIIYLLALAIFCMTTSEFMVAGMMNELALAFQVSVSSIGYLISAYAGAMVIGGPILTAILLRMRSKQALLFLMFIFLIGQSLGAIAWNYDIMMISRIITGIASASAFGVAISFSATLVHSDSRKSCINCTCRFNVRNCIRFTYNNRYFAIFWLAY